MRHQDDSLEKRRHPDASAASGGPAFPPFRTSLRNTRAGPPSLRPDRRCDIRMTVWKSVVILMRAQRAEDLLFRRSVLHCVTQEQVLRRVGLTADATSG